MLGKRLLINPTNPRGKLSIWNRSPDWYHSQHHATPPAHEFFFNDFLVRPVEKFEAKVNGPKVPFQRMNPLSPPTMLFWRKSAFNRRLTRQKEERVSRTKILHRPSSRTILRVFHFTTVFVCDDRLINTDPIRWPHIHLNNEVLFKPEAISRQLAIFSTPVFVKL